MERKFYLINNNRTVNFDFGGSLDNWQVFQICNENNYDDDEIRHHLKANRGDGWEKDDFIEDFIVFKNSDLFEEMDFNN